MTAEWPWDESLDALVAGDPLAPHSLENVGALPLHIISTEVKSPESLG